MKKNNPIGWFEIYVSDISRARKFYESVFQTKLEKMGSENPDLEMWLFPGDLQASGVTGTICKMKGFEPGNNSILVYFSCADCGVVEKRVKEFGGRIQKSKESIGSNGFISLVFDTEGNMIGLHSLK
jgi:predicted enzyme related to lactoylglutathione lyase